MNHLIEIYKKAQENNLRHKFIIVYFDRPRPTNFVRIASKKKKTI